MAKAAIRSDGEGLASALKQAREAEAAHFDAALELRDSKSLRLQLLKDELAPVIQASPEARELFDLTLVPGEPPKLWVDLISSVVMEPDHRTYRFIEDRQDRRHIVFETSDREEMAAAIRRHMAHRLVARERLAAGLPRPPTANGYTAASLILAWTSGFAFGALLLLAAALSAGYLVR
ncbi:hypothetical protein [Aestuariivirga sp.]|uniref:hypothetical protein n=1 Tax=Aestuariivirga sp. TaxID=2650926 RepID=UPI003918D7A1